MTALRFLDTNILLYSISRDPTETAKRDRAVALIDAGGNAPSVQVLQELTTGQAIRLRTFQIQRTELLPFGGDDERIGHLRRSRRHFDLSPSGCFGWWAQPRRDRLP
jgi:predicted nucleic acid-binding protein